MYIIVEKVFLSHLCHTVEVSQQLVKYIINERMKCLYKYFLFYNIRIF